MQLSDSAYLEEEDGLLAGPAWRVHDRGVQVVWQAAPPVGDLLRVAGGHGRIGEPPVVVALEHVRPPAAGGRHGDHGVHGAVGAQRGVLVVFVLVVSVVTPAGPGAAAAAAGPRAAAVPAAAAAARSRWLGRLGRTIQTLRDSGPS